MNPLAIIQNQVKAYNSRDIETFIVCHHPDVELFNFSAQEPFARGREAIRRIYGDVFENSPKLNTEVLNRIVFDNKVIDHEIVTNRKEIAEMELIAIYEIEDEMIRKAHFVRKR